MNRINLETCFPIRHDGPPHALPVLVDLNWFGKVLTSPNAGIVLSRSSSVTFNDDSEVML